MVLSFESLLEVITINGNHKHVDIDIEFVKKLKKKRIKIQSTQPAGNCIVISLFSFSSSIRKFVYDDIK